MQANCIGLINNVDTTRLISSIFFLSTMSHLIISLTYECLTPYISDVFSGDAKCIFPC